jgi:hypothetical protein
MTMPKPKRLSAFTYHEMVGIIKFLEAQMRNYSRKCIVEDGDPSHGQTNVSGIVHPAHIDELINVIGYAHGVLAKLQSRNHV